MFLQYYIINYFICIHFSLIFHKFNENYDRKETANISNDVLIARYTYSRNNNYANVIMEWILDTYL